MQIAADLAELEQLGRVAVERVFAQFRRAPRDTERAIDRRFVGRLGQRLERGHVGRRAGGPEQLGAEPLGRRRDQLDRHAVDGDADGAAVVALDHADDLGQVREAVDDLRAVGRGAYHREPLARVAPPSHVAG